MSGLSSATECADDTGWRDRAVPQLRRDDHGSHGAGSGKSSSVAAPKGKSGSSSTNTCAIPTSQDFGSYCGSGKHYSASSSSTNSCPAPTDFGCGR